MKAHFIIFLLAAGLLTMTSCSTSQGLTKEQVKEKKEAEKIRTQRAKHAANKIMEKLTDPGTATQQFGTFKKQVVLVQKEALIGKDWIKVSFNKQEKNLSLFKNDKRLGSIQENYKVVSEPGVSEEYLIETFEAFADTKKNG